MEIKFDVFVYSLWGVENSERTFNRSKTKVESVTQFLYCMRDVSDISGLLIMLT